MSSQTSKLKSLAGDTAIYGTFSIIGRFLTFMLTPFYTNFMNKSENADIVQIFSVLALINVVNCFGMEAAFFRFNKKDDPETAKKVFTHAYVIIALISLVTSLAGFIMADRIYPFFTSMPDGADLIRLISVIPLMDALVIVPYSLLRSTRKARKFAMTRLAVVLIAVGFNILFLAGFGAGSFGVIWAQLIANVFCIILLLPEVKANLKKGFDSKLTREMLRFGAPTVPANLSSIALQIADRPILKSLTNDDAMAVYSVNCKLAIPMMMFVAVFEYAWKPFYLSNFEEEGAKKLYASVLTYFTIAAAVVFLGTSFFMEYLVQIPFVGRGNLINKEYWSGLGIIPIILAAFYFNGVYTNFAAGFHITKKTEYFPLSIGIAAVVNLAINFAFIPYFGYQAAAWATLTAYIVAAGVLYSRLRKIYPIPYEWKKVITVIVATGSVFFITDFAVQYLGSTAKFFAELAACGIFLGILYAFKIFTKSELLRIKSALLGKFRRSSAGASSK